MRFSPIVRGALVAALVGLSLVTVELARRYADLSRSYDMLRQRSGLPHAGYFVPTFAGRTASGDTLQIGATSDVRHRQLVFVLTTTCPYCRQTLPVWSKLTDSARRLAGWTVDVIGISLDSAAATKRYGEAQGLGFPLVTFPSRKLKQLYRARAVPQTLVLDEEGRVLYARTGLLEPTATLDSVYRALQWVRPQPRQIISSDSNSLSASREP
jgi:peroxiredoxin